MTETENVIKHIVVDIIIISAMWGSLDNNTYKDLFRLGTSLYLISKYL